MNESVLISLNGQECRLSITKEMKEAGAAALEGLSDECGSLDDWAVYAFKAMLQRSAIASSASRTLDSNSPNRTA
jgi:hypothetical protein